MSRERISTDNIPQAKGKLKVLHEDGDTEDIIKVVLDADKFKSKAFCQFAEQFAGKDGLKKLWRFVRFNIKYKEDPFGHQYIQLPPALWKSGVGDCKSKTLFINAVLRCLGISYKTRFVSYGSMKVTHVYTVAMVDGKELPIDAVYTKFGREAPYSYKRDYMTKIAVVSGPSVTQKQSYRGHFASLYENNKGDVEKTLQEVKQKQGTAAAHILLRQLELQKVFHPEKEKLYQEAIVFTKALIYNNGKGFTNNNCITGVIPDSLQALAKVLSSKMKQKQAAVNFNRYKTKSGTPYQTPAPLPIMGYFNANGDFYLGRGTNYNVNWNDVVYNSQYTMGQWYTQIILWMKSEFAKNSSGGNISNTTFLPHVFGPYFTKMIVSGTQANIGPTTILTTTQVKSGNYVMAWYNPDYRDEFENRIKAASGIYDEYIAEIFDIQKGIGNSFIYGYAGDVTLGNGTLNLNQYPQTVAIKSAGHSAWIEKCAAFSGLSNANIKGLGAATVINTSGGQTPTEMLGTLVQAYNPNIGVIPVALVVAIIGLIQTGLGVAAAVMGRSKTDAMQIDPQGIPSDWVPIGPSLEFVDADWDSVQASGNGNTPGNSNNNLTTLLGFGAAGLGLYFLTQNDK